MYTCTYCINAKIILPLQHLFFCLRRLLEDDGILGHSTAENTFASAHVVDQWMKMVCIVVNYMVNKCYQWLVVIWFHNS